MEVVESGVGVLAYLGKSGCAALILMDHFFTKNH